jgi:hypothetical protein
MNSEKTSSSAHNIHANIENSEKWFRESSETMTRAFGKQVEFTTSLYEKAFETVLDLNKAFLENAFSLTEKISESVMENLETLSENFESWSPVSSEDEKKSHAATHSNSQAEKKESASPVQTPVTKTAPVEGRQTVVEPAKRPNPSKN